jgi:hypothetical protein
MEMVLDVYKRPFDPLHPVGDKAPYPGIGWASGQARL